MLFRSGDFADITRDLLQLVAPGRRLAFLEGGYDLGAVSDSVAGTIGAMVDERVSPEPPSHGGPGADAVDVVEVVRRQLL